MIEYHLTIASELEIWPQQTDPDDLHFEPDQADINTEEDDELPRD